MTAYTDSVGFRKGSAAVTAASGFSPVGKIEIPLDFAVIKAARAAAGLTALAAADTLEVVSLPAHCVLLAAGVEVERAETTNTTCTFDLGFTGGSPAAANLFANDLASNALGAAGASMTVNVQYFSSADTIDLLINTAAPTDCKLRVWALVANA